MIKVRIIDRCEFFDGEAYVFICEDVDGKGETFNLQVKLDGGGERLNH